MTVHRMQPDFETTNDPNSAAMAAPQLGSILQRIRQGVSIMSESINVCPISGYLYGVICADLGVYDRIPNAEIFAVRSSEKEPTPNPSGVERGDAKRVLRTTSEDEMQQLATAQNVIQGRTDENGLICLDDPNYQGELLDIYVCLSSVPGPKG